MVVKRSSPVHVNMNQIADWRFQSSLQVLTCSMMASRSQTGSSGTYSEQRFIHALDGFMMLHLHQTLFQSSPFGLAKRRSC